MIKRMRATREQDVWLDMVFDFETKQFAFEMHGMSEGEMDRLEAAGRQLATDGFPRDALILLRSTGYTLWIEVDADTIQFLIREALPNGESHV